MFNEVTSRRPDLLEILTPGRLVVLLYLAVGLGSVYRQDPYGWLVLSLLALAALSSFVRRRSPEKSRMVDSFLLVSTSVAIVAYGVFDVVHRVNIGWVYAATGIAGLIYVSVRRSKSVSQTKG
jgi:hypothetical protein